MSVMPVLQQQVQQPGITFSNAFVTTPVCCPSRSSIVSGRYQHNTRCVRNSIDGGCSSEWWKAHLEANATFAVALQKGNALANADGFGLGSTYLRADVGRAEATARPAPFANCVAMMAAYARRDARRPRHRP